MSTSHPAGQPDETRDAAAEELGFTDPDYSRGWWLDDATAHYYCNDWQGGCVPLCVPQGSLDDDGYPINRAVRLYNDYERRKKPLERPWIDMGKAVGDPCPACQSAMTKLGVRPWCGPSSERAPRRST